MTSFQRQIFSTLANSWVVASYMKRNAPPKDPGVEPPYAVEQKCSSAWSPTFVTATKDFRPNRLIEQGKKAPHWQNGWWHGQWRTIHAHNLHGQASLDLLLGSSWGSACNNWCCVLHYAHVCTFIHQDMIYISTWFWTNDWGKAHFQSVLTKTQVILHLGSGHT